MGLPAEVFAVFVTVPLGIIIALLVWGLLYRAE